MLFWHYQFVSSLARVTSVKFQKLHSVTDNQTHRSDQGYLGPIKINSFKVGKFMSIERENGSKF